MKNSWFTHSKTHSKTQTYVCIHLERERHGTHTKRYERFVCNVVMQHKWMDGGLYRHRVFDQNWSQKKGFLKNN